MAIGGAILRVTSTALRAIECLASIVALGIYSYFLAVLSKHDLPIRNRWKAVEGISGAAVLYTIFGVILTCCLGGVSFFGFVAVGLDILFAGAFIAVAIMTKDGADSCMDYVDTPLGSGPADFESAGPRFGTACRLNTAVFAVSVILIFLFFITAGVQLLLVKRHKADKKYGPSPSNNYTSGRGKFAFWKRNKKVHSTRDAEAATALPHDGRISGETATTLNNPHGVEPKYGQPGYGQATNY